MSKQGCKCDELRQQLHQLEDSMEAAWGIIANASGGNWDDPSQLPGWKQAAERWRDHDWKAVVDRSGEGSK